MGISTYDPERGVLICNVCGETHKSAAAMALHQRSHRPSETCLVCGESVRYLAGHLSRQHPSPSASLHAAQSDLREAAARVNRIAQAGVRVYELVLAHDESQGPLSKTEILALFDPS